MSREYAKLSRTLGGIRDMGRTPSAVWIVDTKKEHLAVDEAKKLGIPIVAILDTNCDPDDVDYPIPGNDDAIRSVSLLTRVVADAVAEGLIARSGSKTGEEEAGSELGTDEPLAEWERELLEQPGAEAPSSDTDAARTGSESPAESAEAVAPGADKVDVDVDPAVAEKDPSESDEPATKAPAAKAAQAGTAKKTAAKKAPAKTAEKKAPATSAEKKADSAE